MLKQDTGPMPSKDTTPPVSSPRRYRVLQTTFVNGKLEHPQKEDGSPNYVFAAAGLEGPALKEEAETAAASPVALQSVTLSPEDQVAIANEIQSLRSSKALLQAQADDLAGQVVTLTKALTAERDQALAAREAAAADAAGLKKEIADLTSQLAAATAPAAEAAARKAK